MRKRGIIREQVWSVLRNPERTVPVDWGRTKYQAEWKLEKGRCILSVVADDNDDPPVVVTVMFEDLSRLGKR
jgi:hypothetical protein